MAYDSGSCANLAAIVTFIQTACTANGWTLAGNVLWKGNTYVEITSDATGVKIWGGTGKDGSNNLNGAGPFPAYLRTIAGAALAYPLNIEIHINTSPDEVYVVINFSTVYYEMLAWGISDVPGLTGSGVWYYGTGSQRSSDDQRFYAGVAGNDYEIGSARYPQHGMMFGINSFTNGSQGGSFIHDDVDSGGWHGTEGDVAITFPLLSPLVACTPSDWNDETILLPFPVYVSRASNKWTLVADMKHIRNARIDFHNPEDSITLGADTWKLYPWFRKSATVLGGVAAATDSGTMGYALRYTGP